YANVYTRCCPQFNPANVTLRSDYAFFPDEIQTRIAAAGVTTLQIGTMHPDLSAIFTNNTRIVTRWVGGANGAFDAFGTDWNWDVYYQMGLSRSKEVVPSTYQRSRFNLAIDAVRSADGTIICRSTL